MNKTYKVYLHICPNNMVYVGVTCQKYLSNRWHKSAYKETALQPYIERYGWENIEHKVVFEFDNEKEALTKEDELIQYYRELGICINQQRSGLVFTKDEKAYYQQYYQDHKEELGEYNRQYQQDHKEEIAEYQRQWRQDHKEERSAYMCQYHQDHKEEHNERSRKWYKDKCENDPEYMEKERNRKRKWRQDHKDKHNESNRKYRAKKKAEKLLQSGQIEIPLAS